MERAERAERAEGAERAERAEGVESKERCAGLNAGQADEPQERSFSPPLKRTIAPRRRSSRLRALREAKREACEEEPRGDGGGGDHPQDFAHLTTEQLAGTYRELQMHEFTRAGHPQVEDMTEEDARICGGFDWLAFLREEDERYMQRVEDELVRRGYQF